MKRTAAAVRFFWCGSTQASLVKGRGTALAVEGFAVHGSDSPCSDANSQRLTANPPKNNFIENCFSAPFDKGAMLGVTLSLYATV